MNIADFINTYLLEQVDYDKAYGAQCVDLFRQYTKDVLEVPEHTGAVEGAKDLYIHYNELPKEKKYFNKIFPISSATAQPGDVAIWGATPTNKYGHVAIVISVLQDKTLLVMEQDGFKQDGAKMKIRTTENLLGYLRGRK